MASLFNIGASGLRAQQAALNVIGQNITNASTPGYTRQRADIAAQGGGSGVLNPGAGARLERIERIADEFIGRQILKDTSVYTELESFSQQIKGLEGALFDGDFGIDASMREFFAALQSAANEPSDVALRQFVISNAQALANRFQGVADRTEIQAQDISARMQSATAQINELSGLMVDLNLRIAALQTERDNGAVNQLLDRRENVLKQLSELVEISTAEQSDGQLNVFIGKGQPLVLGASTAQLSATSGGEILLQPKGSDVAQSVTSAIEGGELGALLRYDQEVLRPAQNKLGHLAAVLSVSLNQQHAMGLDLNGNFGGELFRDVNDPELLDQRVRALFSDVNTSGNGRIDVRIDDPLAARATDYEIAFSQENPGAFTITRVSDREVVFSGASTVPPQTMAFDGIEVTLVDGQFAPGSKSLISPFGQFAGDLSVVLQDPDELALAAPVRTSTHPNNQGETRIQLAQVTDAQHPIFAQADHLMPPLLVEFIAADRYRVLDNTDPTRPVPLEPDLGVINYRPGSNNHILPHLPGMHVVSTSGPNVGLLSDVTSVTSVNPGSNQYPQGSMTVQRTLDNGSFVEDFVSFPANSSAREIAEILSAQIGISASAQTQLTLQNLQISDTTTPPEIVINGFALTGFTDLNELADEIASNETLAAQGISARSDGQSLVLESSYGDDLTVHFQGQPGDAVLAVDVQGQSRQLAGTVPGTYTSVTSGGEVAMILDPGVSVTAAFNGVFAGQPVHQRADYGFDLTMTGSAVAGDRFEIVFNDGSVADNRNAQALVDLSNQTLIGQSGLTFAETFGAIVQDVGSHASQANVNAEAAKTLLTQAENYRESISGVNLDEEAANLIRYEQAYNASAQVISVARDIFNILLNSVA